MGAFVSSAAKSGFLRAFDLNVTNRRWPKDLLDPSQDLENLRSDWIEVGADIKKSEDRFVESCLVGGNRS